MSKRLDEVGSRSIASMRSSICCSRCSKGEMSQVEVAQRLELSQTTISKWLKIFTEAGAANRYARDR